MANTMSMVDLVASLKESLHDSANVFAGEGADADVAFKRFLLQALPDMQIKRPVTKLGQVTLSAGQPEYLVFEPDFAALKAELWSDRSKLPAVWQPSYPGALPRVTAVRAAASLIDDWDEYYNDQPSGRWALMFDPAPTMAMLAVLGRTCQFYFFAAHSINDVGTLTTIGAQDRGLLILRAQVEAMRELAIRNAGKPVSMRDGISGTPRNSTPAALYKELMAEFEGARR